MWHRYIIAEFFIFFLAVVWYHIIRYQHVNWVYLTTIKVLYFLTFAFLLSRYDTPVTSSKLVFVGQRPILPCLPLSCSSSKQEMQTAFLPLSPFFIQNYETFTLVLFYGGIVLQLLQLYIINSSMLNFSFCTFDIFSCIVIFLFFYCFFFKQDVDVEWLR